MDKEFKESVLNLLGSIAAGVAPAASSDQSGPDPLEMLCMLLMGSTDGDNLVASIADSLGRIADAMEERSE
jgi:hypothetical protein